MVEMVGENVTMSKVLSRASFENAIRVNSAIGGSSNAVVHLLTIAGRAGIALDLSDFDALGAALPCILNLRPDGAHLMEDFFEAGGLPAVIRALSEAGQRGRAHVRTPVTNEHIVCRLRLEKQKQKK